MYMELFPAGQLNIMESVIVANGKQQIGVDSQLITFLTHFITRTNFTTTSSRNSMVLLCCQQ